MKSLLAMLGAVIIVCSPTAQAQDEYKQAVRMMLELGWQPERLAETSEQMMMAPSTGAQNDLMTSELLRQNDLSALFLTCPPSDLQLIGLSVDEERLPLLFQRMLNGQSPILLEDVKTWHVSGDTSHRASGGFDLDANSVVKGRFVFRVRKIGDKWVPERLDIITPQDGVLFSIYDHQQQGLSILQIMRKRKLQRLQENNESEPAGGAYGSPEAGEPSAHP